MFHVPVSSISSAEIFSSSWHLRALLIFKRSSLIPDENLFTFPRSYCWNATRLSIIWSTGMQLKEKGWPLLEDNTRSQLNVNLLIWALKFSTLFFSFRLEMDGFPPRETARMTFSFKKNPTSLFSCRSLRCYWSLGNSKVYFLFVIMGWVLQPLNFVLCEMVEDTQLSG